MPPAPAPFFSDPSHLALNAPGPDDHPVLLVSGGNSSKKERFTVAAARPLAILQAERSDGPICLMGGGDGRTLGQFKDLQSAADTALALLAGPDGAREELDAPANGAGPEPGLFGFLTYEYGANFDRMPWREPEATPALWFGLYPVLYVADRNTRKAWWVTRDLNESSAANYGLQKGADESLCHLTAWIDRAQEAQAIRESSAAPPPDLLPHKKIAPDFPSDWRDNWIPSLSEGEYKVALARVREYLLCGDIYQANLTVRYRREVDISPPELFASLLRENPSPYAAFLHMPGWAVLSTSPELFVRVTSNGNVLTSPVKGTMGRSRKSAVPHEAATSAPSSLADSAKDRAEHLMIVDLERNDLGKICEIGSVKVNPLMEVESFVGLDHMISNVSGQLKPGLGAIDVLKALFPGGSISGAPKIRALEVIHELEPVPRGVYTGAIGWIGAEGGAQFNVAIRTLIAANGLIDLHVGGGIVADSDPDAEYEECRIKGEAIARALEINLYTRNPEASGKPLSATAPQK